MDFEKFEGLVNTSSNYEKIRGGLWDFVGDADNIDYGDFEIKLNEVTEAELWSMDIRVISDLEIKDFSFECVVEVEGKIELEERAFGERIKDIVEVDFGVTVSGIIKNDEIIINDIVRIEVL